ncbi:FMN-dependent NADH-azoreductase [Microbacterium pumilum]|uniref:FMN dependent NADH:quinone oxidoreductase n=1 Tax=Microbacterium pumilum TaxID=344165 RepID=A0ABN2S4Q0_9MICO
MPILLQIDSSADASTSRTRALTAAVAAAWRGRGVDYEVVVRDLHADQLPHLRTPAQHWPRRLREGASIPDDLEELQRSVLDELLSADAVVIGAPMYNYSMPSTLKAWVDLIHVPGVTASFDEPSQPLAGRPAVIATARGAAYDPGTRTEGWDHVVPPLQLVLGEGLGMTVHVVATSRTLAERVPDLGARRAAEELEAALAEARRLGSTI